MSHFNGRKKRSFFTKRQHGSTGTPMPRSRALIAMLAEFGNSLRTADPDRYKLLTTRITKRGRKQHHPIGG